MIKDDASGTNGRPDDSIDAAEGPPSANEFGRTIPSAIIKVMMELAEEDNYSSMVGRHHLDRDDAQEVYEEISHQIDLARRELIGHVRRHRMQAHHSVLRPATSREPELRAAIRSRLDLSTFIARHVGMTTVGFQRVGDALVCPCPLPNDTGVDSWLFVDPIQQTWCCTNCGGGDIFDFTFSFFDLRRGALLSFLANEAGLPPIPISDD